VPLLGADLGQTPGNDFVESSRTLTPTENQQVHRRFATGQTLRWRRQPVYLRAQRIANPNAAWQGMGKPQATRLASLASTRLARPAIEFCS
jgi:hypothetical protein